MFKMIQEIISMPRADSGYPHNFGVNSWVFKDDKFETEAKTNSGHRECPLLACTEHTQYPLLACCVSTYTRTHTFISHSPCVYVYLSVSHSLSLSLSLSLTHTLTLHLTNSLDCLLPLPSVLSLALSLSFPLFLSHSLGFVYHQLFSFILLCKIDFKKRLQETIMLENIHST